MTDPSKTIFECILDNWEIGAQPRSPLKPDGIDERHKNIFGSGDQRNTPCIFFWVQVARLSPSVGATHRMGALLVTNSRSLAAINVSNGTATVLGQVIQRRNLRSPLLQSLGAQTINGAGVPRVVYATLPQTDDFIPWGGLKRFCALWGGSRQAYRLEIDHPKFVKIPASFRCVLSALTLQN